MRKVLFKKWIPTIRVDKDGVETPGGSHVKRGTNCWDSEFIHEGLFHEWGTSYEEFESGAGNYTVALIELENGKIEEVLSVNIKFIK